jgi:hypothetical protein
LPPLYLALFGVAEISGEPLRGQTNKNPRRSLSLSLIWKKGEIRFLD